MGTIDTIIYATYCGLMVFALNGLVFMAMMKKYAEIKIVEKKILEYALKSRLSKLRNTNLRRIK